MHRTRVEDWLREDALDRTPDVYEQLQLTLPIICWRCGAEIGEDGVCLNRECLI